MATGDKKQVVMAADRSVANGVATLDADALLAAAQRPKAGGLYRDDGKTTLEKSLTEISTTLQKKVDGLESTDYPGCYYRTVDGVVEWLNPPMLLGVEYRTTERYLCKPVYVKAVDFGGIPSSYPDASSKDVEHGIANVDLVISCNATESNGCTIGNENIWVRADRTKITMWSRVGTSNTATVLLKYTKTTD